MRRLLGMAVLTAAMGAGGAAWAHHSFAMFDQSKQTTLVGAVREFQWTNPHAFIEIAVQATGPADNWSVELNSPNNLRRQGWTRDSLKAGDHVTLVINPLRDGKKGGLFVSAVLADGKVLGDPQRARCGPINVPVAR